MCVCVCMCVQWIEGTKVMPFLSWSPDPTSQLALNALLERCKEVLTKFVHEERLSGQCPLPR